MYVFSTRALNTEEKKHTVVIDQCLKFLEKQDKDFKYQVKLCSTFVGFRKVSKDKRANTTIHIKTATNLEKMRVYIENLAEQQRLGYKKVLK
jgi:prephenate dehydratase